MILPKSVIQDLLSVSGLIFDQAKDFYTLANKISTKTGRSMSATTLKRLFGYITDERKANAYTLNTIAKYIGYESWEDCIQTKQFDSIRNFPDNSIYIHSLSIATEIEVKYLDRQVNFVVINYQGRKALKVLRSINSSLKVDDVLELYRLRGGDCIEAERLIRGLEVGNYKTNGALTSIIVHPS